MPGAITLRARQNPQKRYHGKLGAIVTEKRFSEISSARITANAIARETQLPLGGLFPRLPEKRRQHAGDEANKKAHGGIGVFFQKKRQQLGHTQKTDRRTQNDRQKLRHMCPKRRKGLLSSPSQACKCRTPRRARRRKCRAARSTQSGRPAAPARSGAAHPNDSFSYAIVLSFHFSLKQHDTKKSFLVYNILRGKGRCYSALLAATGRFSYNGK